MSLADVIKALKGQNQSIPGGLVEALTIDATGVDSTVRTTGQFATLEDVSNTVIRANDLGEAIRVKDVAKVRYDLKRTATNVRVDGKPSVRLTVIKKEKGDAIRVVDMVRERLKVMKPELDEKGVTIELVNDASFFVHGN